MQLAGDLLNIVPSNSGGRLSLAQAPIDDSSRKLDPEPLRERASHGQLLLVAGMHRSGTSVLSGTLHMLGMVLGESLLPAAEDNPKGFFENAEIVSIQQRLLESLGRDWHDPTPLPAAWVDSKAAHGAKTGLKLELSKMFELGAKLLVKDPRTSLLVPLWSTMAAEADRELKIAIMVRNPFEVIASLAGRDGISFRRAGLLWLRYMLQVEFDTRGKKRVFLSYRALLTNWRSEVRRISDELGLDLGHDEVQAEMVDRFLDAALYHNRDSDKPNQHPELVRLLGDTEQALLAMCDGNSPTSAREFDLLGRRLEEMAEDYLELIRLNRNYFEQTVRAAALEKLWRPTIPARDVSSPRLYWRKGDEAYSEDRSLGASPTLRNGRFVASFMVPAESEPDFIRFDPDDVPGIFGIVHILANGVELAPKEKLLVSVNEFELPSACAEQLRIGSLSGDSYIELDVRESGRDPIAGGTIEVCFYRESSARYFEESVDGLRWQLKQSECNLDARVTSFEGKLSERLGEASTQMASLGDGLQTQVQALLDQQLEVERRRDADAMAAASSAAELTAVLQYVAGLPTQMQALCDQQLEVERRRNADAAAAASSAAELAAALSAVGTELKEARENQKILKVWAERRSLSYWWRRLRRLR